MIVKWTHKIMERYESLPVCADGTDSLKAILSPNAFLSPVAMQNSSKGAMLAPDVSLTSGLAGDETLYVTGDSTWAYGDKKYALPALIVIVLIILSGIGIFIVHRRRKMAATYSGLKESELNSVQMHRS